jgi:hypothetical protein
MFVRFRKIPNDGACPIAVRTEAAFWNWGGVRQRARRRWVIGQERRQPYRIKVLVVENIRANGKVKQETIVALGSFDATWLDAFYEGMDASIRVEGWRSASLSRRIRFWDGVIERMREIGDNRLSADDRKQIRRAIHKVIPVADGGRAQGAAVSRCAG